MTITLRRQLTRKTPLDGVFEFRTYLGAGNYSEWQSCNWDWARKVVMDDKYEVRRREPIPMLPKVAGR